MRRWWVAPKLIGRPLLLTDVRRRVLRDPREGTKYRHQLGIMLTPIGAEAGRKASSALGTVLYAPGALLLLVSFGVVMLNWLAGMLGDVTIPSILAPFIPWAPVMFAIGVVLSVIGSILSPSIERFLLLMVFAAGFLAIWLGII